MDLQLITKPALKRGSMNLKNRRNKYGGIRSNDKTRGTSFMGDSELALANEKILDWKNAIKDEDPHDGNST